MSNDRDVRFDEAVSNGLDAMSADRQRFDEAVSKGLGQLDAMAVQRQQVDEWVQKGLDAMGESDPKNKTYDSILKSTSKGLGQFATGAAGAIGGLTELVEKSTLASMSASPVHLLSMATKPLDLTKIEAKGPLDADTIASLKAVGYTDEDIARDQKARGSTPEGAMNAWWNKNVVPVSKQLDAVATSIEKNGPDWQKQSLLNALGVDPKGGMGKWIREQAKSAENYAYKMNAKPGAETVAFNTFGSFLNMAPWIVAGALTRNPSLALEGMSVMAGGSRAAELFEKGFSPGVALAGATAEGLSEWGTEKMPFDILTKPGIAYWRRFAHSLPAEVMGETLATTAQTGIIDRATINPNLTKEQFAQSMVDTWIQTSLLQFPFTTIGHYGSRRYVNRTTDAMGKMAQPDIVAKMTDEQLVNMTGHARQLLAELPEKARQRETLTNALDVFTGTLERRHAPDKGDDYFVDVQRRLDTGEVPLGNADALGDFLAGEKGSLNPADYDRLSTLVDVNKSYPSRLVDLHTQDPMRDDVNKEIISLVAKGRIGDFKGFTGPSAESPIMAGFETPSAGNIVHGLPVSPAPDTIDTMATTWAGNVTPVQEEAPSVPQQVSFAPGTTAYVRATGKTVTVDKVYQKGGVVTVRDETGKAMTVPMKRLTMEAPKKEEAPVVAPAEEVTPPADTIKVAKGQIGNFKGFTGEQAVEGTVQAGFEGTSLPGKVVKDLLGPVDRLEITNRPFEKQFPISKQSVGSFKVGNSVIVRNTGDRAIVKTIQPKTKQVVVQVSDGSFKKLPVGQITASLPQAPKVVPAEIPAGIPPMKPVAPKKGKKGAKETKPLASKATTSSTVPLTPPSSPRFGPKTIQAHLAHILKKLPNAGTVQVVHNESALPVDVAERSGIMEYTQSGETVYGFFNPRTDTIYILADNISSLQDARTVLTHELMHRGVFALLTKQERASIWRDLLKEYEGTPVMQGIMTDYNPDLSTEEGREIAGNELIAHLGQRTERPTLWDKIVRMFRIALKRLGLGTYTESQAEALIRKSWEYAEKGLPSATKGDTIAPMSKKGPGDSTKTSPAKPEGGKEPRIYNEGDPIMKTGEPITLAFTRHTTKSPNMGSRFAQDIEPKGEYMNYHKKSWGMLDGKQYEYGQITFKNPLVLEHKTTAHGGWKTDLSEMYGGKKGKTLSNAIIKDGYDAIITIGDFQDKDENGRPITVTITQEIVNLAGVKSPNPSRSPAQGEQPVASKQSPDTRYLEAVKRGDLFVARDMVERAAKESGYASELTYHGTNSELTKFDKAMRGNLTDAQSAKMATFVVADEVTAETYAIYAAENSAIKEAMRKADEAERKGKWDDYDKWVQEYERLEKESSRDDARILKLYVKSDNLTTWDAKGRSYNEMEDGELSLQLSKAKKAGKDGIRILNFDDAIGLSGVPATHYAMFSPNHIKSADPVVYDDQGNVIPLSQRFNEAKDDIRFMKKAKPYGSEPSDPSPDPMNPETWDTSFKEHVGAASKALWESRKLPQAGLFERIMTSPEWWQDPVLNKLYQIHAETREELAHGHLIDMNEIDGQTVSKVEAALKRKDPAGYDLYRRFMDEGDTTWERDTSKLADPKVSEDEKAAIVKEQQAAFEDYMRKNGATEQVIEVWRLARKSLDVGFDKMTAEMRRLEQALTEAGDEAKVNELKRAMAQMNRWRGFYAPRIRPEGNWKITGYKRKKGSAPTVRFILGDEEGTKTERSIQIYEPSAIRKDSYHTVTARGNSFGFPSAPGVKYVMGRKADTGEEVIQAVTFKKDAYTQEQARAWWRTNERPIINSQTKEFFSTTGSKREMLLAKNRMTREGWAMGDVKEIEKVPEDVYLGIKQADLSAALKVIIEKATGDEQAKEAAALSAKLDYDLIQEAANFLKSRGFRSSMIHRKEGSVVKGYITDPMERRLLYVTRTANGLAKAEAAKQSVKVLMGTYNKATKKTEGGLHPARDARKFALATKFLDEVLRNTDVIDRYIGLAKSIATFKFLGFNPRSVAVNITALATTAPVAIRQYVGRAKVSIPRVMKELGVASEQYWAYRMGKLGQFTPDEIRLLDDMKKKGYDAPQYTRDVAGMLQSKPGWLWSKAMTGAMWLFGQSERWIRGTTVLAGYRIGRHVGMTHEEAEKAAKKASDNAHGNYTRASKPEVTWGTGAGRIGTLMYSYSKFGHNYMQMLYDLSVRRHDLQGFLYGLISPVVIGGLMAFPFKDLFFSIIKAFMKRDPEKAFWDYVRELFGDTTEKGLRHGLVGLAGWDIASSLSVTAEMPGGLVDLLGAPGQAVASLMEGAKYLGEGKWGRAGEKILPAAGRNILQATRESTDGVTTKYGNTVFNREGEPLKLSGWQAVSRVLGARSTDQAVLTERAHEAKREEKSFATWKDAIYQRYKDYVRSPDDAVGEAILKEIEAYNDTIIAHQLYTVDPITPESLDRVMEHVFVPSKKEYLRVK